MILLRAEIWEDSALIRSARWTEREDIYRRVEKLANAVCENNPRSIVRTWKEPATNTLVIEVVGSVNYGK